MEKGISRVLTAAGIAVAVLTIVSAILGIYAPPVMLKRPEKALSRVQILLDAVCMGGYEEASQVLYGQPDLGAVPETASYSEVLLWQAYRDSLHYEILGDCYASNTALAVNVRWQYLDLNASLSGIHERVRETLSQRIARTEDLTTLYDEEQNYHPELIQEILVETIQRLLQENKTCQEKSMTLHLVYGQGQWWIMPETPLLQILSGSVSN